MPHDAALTKRDLEGLAAKLDGLTLTDAEHDMMLTVFGLASTALDREVKENSDVDGFAIGPPYHQRVNRASAVGPPNRASTGLAIGPPQKILLSESFTGIFGLQ